MKRGTWTSGLLLMAASTAPLTLKAEPERNVLFITVDDFRPELPAYGRDHVHAPHMTRLTDEGLTFNHAYVQQAVCQPARANVLTGARPDTTRIYGVFEGGWPTFRTTLGNDFDTLPSLFKDNGYWTAGYGKNFHHVDNPSWTVHETFYQTIDLYQLDENRAVAGDVNERPPWEYFPDNLETNTMDAKVADAAVQAIQARAVDGQPFFIAAGFWKPHLPFSAPQQYWDLYDRETLPIATGLDALPVQGAIPTAFYDPFSGELTTYRGGRPPFVGQTPETQAALANGTFTNNQQTGDDWGIITVEGTHIYPEDYARALTHGYYACTSFIDAQIGKILDALEDPLGDGSVNFLTNTVIVLWGDHGMHVGQHGSWPKHTNMDIATRIPFIIWDPDMPEGTRGVMTDALMESVDIMPTVLEMVGIPKPSPHPFEGVSLVPLLDDPHQAWKTAAFSQYPKEVPMNSGIWYMGYAMRTPYHTYMQWRELDATDANPISLAQRNFTISNRVAYEELYDMVNDPSQRVNLSGDPQYRPLLDALGAKLDMALITNYANTQQVGVTEPAAPVAHAVAFFGGTDVGDTLTAHYIYSDANGNLEDGTTLEWVRAEAFNGPYETVVGTGATYTLQAGDAGAFVKLRVTPQTDVAPTTGEPVLSATAVVAGVGFNDGVGLPAPESAVYEGFDYAEGVISSSSAGGRGWNGGWWGNDGLTFGGNSGAQSVNFTWENLPAGYYHEPIGRAASNGGNVNNPYRQLHSAQTIDLAQNGTRYFSFLYHHNGSAPVFEKRWHAGTSEVLKLQINASGSLSLISPDETNMNLLTLDANTAYVVLGRIQSVASGNDTLSISVYKSGDTVPDSPPAFSASVNVESGATIDRIFMGNPFNDANTGNSHWDELHIDPVYAAVVGSASEEEGPPVVPPTVVETFDYDAGGVNASNAGGIGWDGGWYGNVDLDWSGNSGAAAGDKSWSLPTGYHYTPEGRSGMNHTHANTPFRGLATDAQIDLTSDTVYFSFLFSHDSSSMFEYRFYAGTTEITKLQVDDNGQLRLVGAAFHPTGFHLTSEADYLITGKLVGNAVGDDTLYVSVYDSSATVPEAEPTFSHSANFESSATIDRIMLGIAGNAAAVATYWDELRMGPSWGSVIGVGGEEPDPDPGPDPDPDPPEAVLMLHLTFDEGDLTDSSPDNRNVTGSPGFASEGGRNYATLNGVDQAITAPILGAFTNGLSIAFWTLAQDGEDGMPKNTALGWARQGGTTGDLGDGLLLGFGWNNAANALVRVGRENNVHDEIAIPALENWLNAWVHWTVVKNLVEGTIQVYRDGELYSSVGNRTIIPAFEEQGWATGSGFRIGRYFDTYYKGYLDDYRLYHGVLTPQEVQTIYQLGAATGPTAFNVSISGTPEVGQTLTGNYDFVHPGGDEGDSRYQWYSADTAQGSHQPIEDATGLTYQVTGSDEGRYLIFGVTPVGDDEAEGDEAFSDPFLIGIFVDRSLENTVYRLHEDQSLAVAFFGGSITDGVGQNNGLPWRTRTENWLTSTYPEVSFTFVNAAISGTSSEFGVFRADRHVLAYAPDLIFVEFAVNDKEQVSDTRTRATMEGIVRKIRAAQPTADIVFVYTTVRADAINYYENDQLPPRTLIHQQVAGHYGVPVIDVAAALVAHKQMTGYPYRIEYGEPGWNSPTANHYLPDHVHPSNLGHEVYGDEVQAVLTALLDITPPAAPVAHADPGLLSGYDMVSARILDHTHPDVSYGTGWDVQTLGIGGGGRTDDFLVTESASTASDIEVAFRGAELGVYYRRMTNGAEIVWNVDDGAAGDTFVFWHETLGSFTSQAMLTTELGAGNHTAVITPQPHNGHEKLAIAGWLVLGEHAVLYQDWADDVFAGLDGGSAHPDAAPTADLDGNGWANLTEYAMGTDPSDPDEAPWWRHERNAQEGDVLILYRRRSPPASDVHITVEGRMELTQGDWLSGPTFSEIVDIQPEGDTEVVTERIIVPGIEEAMQYYFRLLFDTDL